MLTTRSRTHVGCLYTAKSLPTNNLKRPTTEKKNRCKHQIARSNSVGKIIQRQQVNKQLEMSVRLKMITKPKVESVGVQAGSSLEQRIQEQVKRMLEYNRNKKSIIFNRKSPEKPQNRQGFVLKKPPLPTTTANNSNKPSKPVQKQREAKQNEPLKTITPDYICESIVRKVQPRRTYSSRQQSIDKLSAAYYEKLAQYQSNRSVLQNLINNF